MDKNNATSALLAIPTPGDRETWLKLTTAYKAAGGDFETWDEWSRKGENYNQANNAAAWRSISADGGITEKTLFDEARRNGWKTTGAFTGERQARPTTQKTAVTPTQRQSIEKFIAEAEKHQGKIIDYTASRGLHQDTIARFRLGYDDLRNRLVIPYPGKSYYITRSLEIEPNERNPDKAKGAKYSFPPKSIAGERPIFNSPALTGGADIVFITEGEIDAISVEQYGGAAVACNAPGVMMKAIAETGDKLTAKTFLIIPDNDTDENGNADQEKGEKKAAEMLNELTAAGFSAFLYHIEEKYHDANEMARKAPGDFWEWINQGGAFIQERERQEIEAYKSNTGAAKIQKLEEVIQRNATREAIKTGFPTLDDELGEAGHPGGLYPGLYFIGAISSLGKTTFCIQMADQIAESGQDVLFFSLEMADTEIIGKSISRLTWHTAPTENAKKTYRGIISGARYAKYSPAEIKTINAAKERYRKIAEHLFIFDGLGCISVHDIRKIVEKHLSITGCRPVVFIDYLQIIAPDDSRATEKQNTDRAVVELKRISRDHDIPVIAISSFNRENYKNEVSEIAFKESGAIEYSSDVLIGLQFRGAGSPTFNARAAKAQTPREVELIVLKNRNGRLPNFPVSFSFYPLFNYYEDKKPQRLEHYAPPIRL